MKTLPTVSARGVVLAFWLATLVLRPADAAAQSFDGESLRETDTESGSQVIAAPDELLETITRLSARLDAIEQAQAATQQEAVPDDADKPIVPTINWTGQLQLDSYGFSQSDANKAQFGDFENGTAFRRTRLGALGEYGSAEYRIEVDFALAGRPSFLDVYAGVKKVPVLGTVRVGHFFEPFSLERLTANRFTIFMERSLADQAFAPARNSGVMARNQFFDSNMTAAVGIFRSNSDVFGDDVGDRFETAITSRVTGLLWYRDACQTLDYFHVGSAYSYRGADQDRLRFSAQPEARLGSVLVGNVPSLVDTGFFAADDSQLVGGELAWVRGPLMISSEYMATRIDAFGPTVQFDGGYVAATYFLTGESRPYNKVLGTFDRVIPRNSFISGEGGKIGGGAGAWELTSRFSQVDLNDDPVFGGRLTNYTVGLNWYLNPYLRWTFNYIHAVPVRDAGESSVDIFGSRIGFDF